MARPPFRNMYLQPRAPDVALKGARTAKETSFMVRCDVIITGIVKIVSNTWLGIMVRNHGSRSVPSSDFWTGSL